MAHLRIETKRHDANPPLVTINRARLELIIANAIDLLDLFDGDPDTEEDDAAGQYNEDCYTGRPPKGYGPGCPLSDPGGGEHDGAEPEDDGLVPHYRMDQSAGMIGPYCAAPADIQL